MRKKFGIRGGVNSFTLLEMLGVLAVMAILASVAVPPMLRSLQNAQSVNEDKNLEEIGRALCEAIKAEGQVPDPGALATATTSGNKGWVAMVAPYCSMASNSIQYVYPDRTETERRYYILTLNSGVPTILSPQSYTVGLTGWSADPLVGNWPGIQTSFLVLISSSKPDYLLACPANSGTATYTTWANLPGSPTAVNWAAKDWVKQAVNGVYSATNTEIVGTIQNASGTWTDKGQFLHVKVIPMSSLICNLNINLVSYFGLEVAGDGFYIGLGVFPFAPNFPSLANPIYIARGSSITVKAGVSSGGVKVATTTATAASSSLNFTYTDPGGMSPAFWNVNP
jgi:type II secretory pathway pseudopilin PulG